MLRRFAPRNDVVPVLFAVGAVAALTGSFVNAAPNRLLSGRPIGLFTANPRLGSVIALFGIGLLASAMVPPTRWLHRAVAASGGALLLLTLAAAGQAAAALSGGSGLARIALGAAFWMLLGTSALAVVDGLQRAMAGVAERLAIVVVLVLAIAAMAWTGMFDALSLAREYHTRQALFVTALIRHIELVAASVGPALLLGVPIGVMAVSRPRAQGPVFAVLNVLQTIPSIALFGLLIAPLAGLAAAMPGLAALGVGGVGPAPAIIALILYALLPVVRNTVAGITGVDPAVIDAARGMGMTQRQRFWRIELPLALPLLLAGLRIVTVQAIGLAVVAALIGAGGLGTFVFEGLGQSATDLVLLGALPAIVLALAADSLLQLLSAAVAR